LKGSLKSNQIKLLLSKASNFKTDNFSFKYLLSFPSGVGFSINKTLGNAARRNLIKRKVRAIVRRDFFCDYKLQLLVRPLSVLKQSKHFLSDFQLLKKHLKSQKI